MSVDGVSFGGLCSGSRRLTGVAAIAVLIATIVVVAPRVEADHDESGMHTYSGTITDAATGAPLSGVTVGVLCSCGDWGATTMIGPWAHGGRTLLVETSSDSSGRWSVTFSEPDDYWDDISIFFWDPDDEYGPSYLGRVASWRLADESDLDAEMSVGARFSGRILDDGGPPPAGLSLRVSSYSNSTGGAVLVLDVAGDGSYTTPALADGSYSLVPTGFDTGVYVGGDYGRIEVTVSDGVAVSGGQESPFDSELKKWIYVSGLVTDGSGTGLGGIYVGATGTFEGSHSPLGVSLGSYDLASPVGGRYLGSLGAIGINSAVTASDGSYTLRAHPESTVTVCFGSENGSGRYRPECYDDKPFGGDPQDLSGLTELTDINAQLALAPSISIAIVGFPAEDQNASAKLCSLPCEFARWSGFSPAGITEFYGLNEGTHSLDVEVRDWSSSPSRTLSVTKQVDLEDGVHRHFEVVFDSDGDDHQIKDGSAASDTFDDIDVDAIYERAVDWMIANKITTGCSQDPPLFCPEDDLTRAQFVTFLWRALGRPAPSQSGAEAFSDVPPGHFADQAVGWAKEQGVTTGCSSVAFCLNDPLTRGQIATFMYRFTGLDDWWGDVFDQHYGGPGALPADVPPGRYFTYPVAWTRQLGLISGCGAGLFCPESTADRATTAMFIYAVANRYSQAFSGL
ncbi:MAG: carboxypeptidase-like regulatory domain-containing protein [Acidimicrobiaceae bacterium]|nr:carboxypeptidase-like regulatory domain-containing protein [Acidimicrobiaceae bacterium]MYA75447.1 carboxypeptidase-like regulatory domain-containing protein [Acidimicrobiaceae bacterium]MYD07535.1 carboxypeptidase-like regulatory domain-containing protein [Acidimicrobiaceae bacterium]MYG55377.1 carboxypeptidase-like regulatory domain-containing protein [Acidimicrobiaceae bacterium]MYI58389.1 carboxypeptidase-like regulatory domain-containing protein [Acidimicrobiaceae bacterium]